MKLKTKLENEMYDSLTKDREMQRNLGRTGTSARIDGQMRCL